MVGEKKRNVAWGNFIPMCILLSRVRIKNNDQTVIRCQSRWKNKEESKQQRSFVVQRASRSPQPQDRLTSVQRLVAMIKTLPHKTQSVLLAHLLPPSVYVIFLGLPLPRFLFGAGISFWFSVNFLELPLLRFCAGVDTSCWLVVEASFVSEFVLDTVTLLSIVCFVWLSGSSDSELSDSSIVSV